MPSTRTQKKRRLALLLHRIEFFRHYPLTDINHTIQILGTTGGQHSANYAQYGRAHRALSAPPHSQILRAPAPAIADGPRMTSRRDSKSPGDGSFVITVRAKPRSAVSSLEKGSAGTWIARLRSSPVEGKANAELVVLVAKHFGCAKSSVSVTSGASARLKLIRISGNAPVRDKGAS
jgi:uncharacterized protein